MDFGIARPTEVSLHTIGGKVMGSLAYLSPEQLEGKDIDHRSDIFSLGSVLYEMVTGQRAYPQKTISELVRHKSKGEFAPVDSFGITIPPSLVETINKSMALSPDDRFPTAAEMGHALYREFKTIAERSPSDVMYQFITNPSAPMSAAEGVAMRLGTGRKSGRAALIAAAAGAVVLLLAVLFAIGKLTGLLP